MSRTREKRWKGGADGHSSGNVNDKKRGGNGEEEDGGGSRGERDGVHSAADAVIDSAAMFAVGTTSGRVQLRSALNGSVYVGDADNGDKSPHELRIVGGAASVCRYRDGALSPGAASGGAARHAVNGGTNGFATAAAAAAAADGDDDPDENEQIGVVDIAALAPGHLLVATSDQMLYVVRVARDRHYRAASPSLRIVATVLGNPDEVYDVQYVSSAASPSSPGADDGALDGVTKDDADESTPTTADCDTSDCDRNDAARRGPQRLEHPQQRLQRHRAHPLPPRLIAIASNAHAIHMYDLNATPRFTTCAGVCAGHTDAVLAIAPCHVADAPFQLASASKDDTVRVWTDAPAHHGASRASSSSPAMLSSWRCAGVGVGHGGAVNDIACGTRRAFVVSAGSTDRAIKMWVAAKHAHASVVAANDDDASTKFGAPAQLECAWTIGAAHARDINSVAVSPGDTVLASASQDKTVKLWSIHAASSPPAASVPTPTLMRTLNGHRRGVWCVQFSPVDRVVASASADRTVRLWSVRDGACLRSLESSSGGADAIGSVLRCAFMSLGTQLVTGGSDGALGVWNVRGGEEVGGAIATAPVASAAGAQSAGVALSTATSIAHADRMWALAVADDGAELVSGGADGRIIVWRDVTAETAEREARARDEAVLREQQVSNAIQSGEWARAFTGALELEQPARLRTVIEKALARAPLSPRGRSQQQEHETDVDSLVRRVGRDASMLRRLLRYVRDWNTTAHGVDAAHAVLRAVLRMHYPPAALCDFIGGGEAGGSRAAMEELRELTEAFVAYTERHYARAARTQEQVCLFDLALDKMGAIAAPERDA